MCDTPEKIDQGITFEMYNKWFDKFVKNNDKREINFQNEVVKKLLCSIDDELDIIPCGTKGPDTKRHDYLQYCGTYRTKKGKEKPTTPDLIIAKNWNWLNKDNIVDYRAVVEVKSPYEKQRIYNKNFDKYGNTLQTQLERHQSATKNKRVILTDALKWEFYTKEAVSENPKTYILYNLKQCGKWEWNESQFEDLKKFLKKFINKEVY